jgi:hypothetical protein
MSQSVISCPPLSDSHNGAEENPKIRRKLYSKCYRYLLIENPFSQMVLLDLLISKTCLCSRDLGGPGAAGRVGSKKGTPGADAGADGSGWEYLGAGSTKSKTGGWAISVGT